MTTGHDIAMALRAAYWAMHRCAEAGFAPAGVTADQFVLLSALADSAKDGAARVDASGGVTQQELVRRTASDPSTIRAMLVLLERRGLVVRRPHPADRRARSVSLTAKGRRLFERLWAGGGEFRDQLRGACAPIDPDHLVDTLRRIAEAMSRPPGRQFPHWSRGGRPVSRRVQRT